MTLDVKSDYVSSPQAARMLRITSVGVAQLARQGKIPAVKIANRWLIPRAFVEEFARTYQGKRGRPRKSGRLAAGYLAIPTAVEPTLTAPDAVADLSLLRQEASAIPAINAWVADSEDTPVVPTPETTTPPTEANRTADSGVTLDVASTIDAGTDQKQCMPPALPQPDEPPPVTATPLSEAAVSPESQTGASLDTGAPLDSFQEMVDSVAAVSEPGMSEAVVAAEATDTSRPGEGAFSISAEVFHLDRNYDFEVYDKGRITEGARLIVARLKPKIPSLPEFSFRWDYRYEHLNVDIHGVEPNVKEWWTMGENGYTGHLPRRLGGAGYVFEAIIWLPVTFVFRGRLTLSLSSSTVEEDSSSVAATTGGLRRLWTRWTRNSGS